MDIPGKMMNSPGSRQYRGTPRRTRDADQSVPRDLERGFPIRRYFHDAAFSGEGSGYIEIAVDIEGQTLRTTEPPVEGSDVAVRVDLVHAIEAGCRRTRYE